MAINFPFEPYSDKWMVVYEQLKEFINKNGRFPKPLLDKKGAKFYNWLKNQINKFSQLSKHQQKLLEEINYQDFEIQFNNWHKSYERLVDFIQKNQRLPKPDREKSEENNIYAWLINQRRQYRDNQLEKDQINLLLVLESVDDFFQRQRRRSLKSLDRCEELAEFRKNNPERWPSIASSSGKQEKDLALWLSYIKNWYKGNVQYNNDFPKELSDELLKIGFDPSLNLRNSRTRFSKN